jgi:hypothetical protein
MGDYCHTLSDLKSTLLSAWPPVGPAKTDKGHNPGCGGNGGLPITAVPAALISGIGALLLAVGAVLVLVDWRGAAPPEWFMNRR